VVSAEQKERVATLSQIHNAMACIAYGWREAMDHILYFENL